MIARTTLWGTIQFGDEFYRLTELEQCAIVEHEKGHIHHRHALERLWRIATFRWKGFFMLCEMQEFEADQYAVARGHRAGLTAFLLRGNLNAKTIGYPTHKQRIEAIHG